MYIVLLRFAENRDQVGRHVEAHKQWLQRGFAEGDFLLAGTLPPKLGGGILARAMPREDLQARIDQDPFVAERVVTAEIVEITPSITDPRLAFLAEA